MSTQKSKIKNPKLARRTKESILAEVLLCKLFNWKIEFLSSGLESYDFDELVSLAKDIYSVYGEKLWLNIGVLSEKELFALKPYIIGVCGAVECINPDLRKKLCPSKPLEEIENMFKLCDRLGLKKSMTLILGLGEEIGDFEILKHFIEKNNIDQITFYRLKPQKATIYEKINPITKEYYAEWVKKARKHFPGIKIIVGSWLSHLDELSLLLKSGADGITKFPSIKEFNSAYAKKIQEEVEKSGMVFKSNLTKQKKININKELNNYYFDSALKEKISEKLREYLGSML
jgi:biotin synthase-like enzyme